MGGGIIHDSLFMIHRFWFIGDFILNIKVLYKNCPVTYETITFNFNLINIINHFALSYNINMVIAHGAITIYNRERDRKGLILIKLIILIFK